MDSFDEKMFQELLQEKTEEKLNNAKEQVEQILKDCLNSELYDVFVPTIYHRTYNLLNSVTTELDTSNNILYLYPDISNNQYQSAVTGENVGQYLVDWLLTTGHHDNTGVMSSRTCPRIACRYQWVPRVPQPKACPRCHTRLDRPLAKTPTPKRVA